MLPVIPDSAAASSVPLLAELELPQSVSDGERELVKVRIRNTGNSRIYWPRVRHEIVRDEKNTNPLAFSCPGRAIGKAAFIESGKTLGLECYVSAFVRRADPREEDAELNLIVTAQGANAVTLSVNIPVLTPTLRLLGARILGDNESVQVTVRNDGQLPLETTEFKASINGEPVSQTVTRRISENMTVDLSFPISKALELGNKPLLFLSARTSGLPLHLWELETQIEIPTTAMIISIWIALGVGVLLAAFYLRVYRNPLLVHLSVSPVELVATTLDRLPAARRYLRLTRRLDDVLAVAGVTSASLEQAITFDYQAALERARYFARRLRAQCEEKRSSGAIPRFVLRLSDEFILNLPSFELWLPNEAVSVSELRDALRIASSSVIVIIGETAPQRQALRQGLSSSGYLWVALEGPELSSILLSAQPEEAFARTVATQISVSEVSPYQTRSGVGRDSIFFGRAKLLTRIINREPANYHVVGGRQVGKSSLLKALNRRYQADPATDCSYTVLYGASIASSLAKTLGLPLDVEIDGVVSHLREASPKGRRLLLIDESDLFMGAEKRTGYKTLQQFRSLSEEGLCHFVFAGYWELYYAASQDYQSPIKNFGEMLEVGALEPEACRALANKPMASVNIRWESEELVDRLIEKTGYRANLIAIACNEILGVIDPETRVINAEHLELGLSCNDVRDAIAGWETLAGSETDDRGNRLVNKERANRFIRVVVYSMIESDSFSLSDLMTRLDQLGLLEGFGPEQVKNSLLRLELAYVIGRKKDRYFFVVPILRDRIRTEDPEMMLRQEIARLG